jgi:hypothetical protein
MKTDLKSDKFEDIEMEEYIRACLKLTPIERLRFAERNLRDWYALMPDKAKKIFDKLRWEEGNR